MNSQQELPLKIDENNVMKCKDLDINLILYPLKNSDQSQ